MRQIGSVLKGSRCHFSVHVMIARILGKIFESDFVLIVLLVQVIDDARAI